MTSWLRERLHEHEDSVDPETYAMSLFYVHHDVQHYLETKDDLAERRG